MTRSIPLSRGLVALVDDDDYARLSRFTWHANVHERTTYAYRNEDGRPVYMHRAVIGASSDRFVDHVNGDGLDNRRLNLRPATHVENQQNRRKRRGSVSSFKGVTWHGPSRKWRATITVNGRVRSLGYFATELDAACAYDAAAHQAFGAFARTNDASRVVG